MRLPNFLIIGAAKAGTTSLQHYLKQHPQVFMSKAKEPNFFAYESEVLDFQGPGNEIFNKNTVTNFNDYCSLFKESKSEIAIGEASTHYLYRPKAPEKIKKYLPEVKLIAILRHPVDRAYSQYLMNLRRNIESKSFEAVIENEEQRIKSRTLPVIPYLRGGLYSQQISRYYNLFDESNLKIFLYEDFLLRPKALFKEICDFLNIDQSFQPDTSVKANVSGIPKNLLIHQFLTSPNIAKIALKPFLPEKIRLKLTTSLRNKNLYKPEMSNTTYNNLLETYQDDIESLQVLIKRDLSHWLVYKRNE